MTAIEMFEELGYELIGQQTRYDIFEKKYSGGTSYYIEFEKFSRVHEVYMLKDIYDTSSEHLSSACTPHEFRAICKYYQEMGWL